MEISIIELLVVVFVGGFLIVALVFYFAYKHLKNRIRKQQSISMNEIINFFKQERFLKIMKENPDIVPAVFREKKSRKIRIRLALINKKTKKIYIENIDDILEYDVKKVEEAVSAAFKDKDKFVINFSR